MARLIRAANSSIPASSPSKRPMANSGTSFSRPCVSARRRFPCCRSPAKRITIGRNNALDADEKSLDEMLKQGQHPKLIETGWDPTRQPWCTVESREVFIPPGGNTV